jgi:ABC-type sugar transport system ATPase subunit
VSFTLHSGEILGLAGLVGAGRTDVARAIFGAEDVDAGEVYLAGQRIPQGSPRAAIKAGIGFVTEDRKLQSLFLPLNVLDNVIMPKTEAMATAGVLDAKSERRLTHDFVQRLEIKTPSLAQEVSNLSGGNQQKVVLARWLAIEPKVLIVDEPTRGIDVGAKAEIHAILSRLAASGVGILLISSEMNEILALSDRILVMRDGRIAGEFGAENATQEAIAACALGLEHGA